MEWFRGGLACKAHILLYHSTLGSREINKEKGQDVREVVDERREDEPPLLSELITLHKVILQKVEWTRRDKTYANT